MNCPQDLTAEKVDRDRAAEMIYSWEPFLRHDDTMRSSEFEIVAWADAPAWHRNRAYERADLIAALLPAPTKQEGHVKETPESEHVDADVSKDGENLDTSDPAEIWLWFAVNGNIRKWDSKPFDGATRYVATPQSSTDERGAVTEQIVCAFEEEPFMDDLPLMGTTQQSARFAHYARIAAAFLPPTKQESQTLAQRDGVSSLSADAGLATSLADRGGMSATPSSLTDEREAIAPAIARLEAMCAEGHIYPSEAYGAFMHPMAVMTGDVRKLILALRHPEPAAEGE